VALIIIIREFTVVALRGMAALEGRVMRPSIWGKLKANVQFIAIGLAMVRLAEPLGPLYLDEWVMWAAAAVTIASGWQYVSSFWSVVRAADRS
jgi:phosphatidylglycerophosphate synthase